MVVIYMSRPPNKIELDEAIRAAGIRRNINTVIHIVQILGTQADAYTYTAVITAAGNCNRLDVLIDAYHRATAQGEYQHSRRNIADVVTLSSAITAAGNCNLMGLAEEARIALANNQADVVMRANIHVGIPAHFLNRNTFISHQSEAPLARLIPCTFLTPPAVAASNEWREGIAATQSVLTKRYRHNPYSLACSRTPVKTAPSTATALNPVALRR